MRRVIDTNKFQISVVCAVALDGFLVVVGLMVAGDGLSATAQALHYTTVGMLCMFVVEVFVRILALRCQFYRRRMELFDAVTVAVTFALAIVFAKDENVRSCAGLLILLRLWRVARILNGLCSCCLIFHCTCVLPALLSHIVFDCMEDPLNFSLVILKSFSALTCKGSNLFNRLKVPLA